jgi:hypothetical protein
MHKLFSSSWNMQHMVYVFMILRLNKTPPAILTWQKASLQQCPESMSTT